MYTAKHHFPLMAAGQAQKHVTHNEALLLIDDLLNLSVIRDDLTVPPTAPAEGDSYIVASPATGAWAGKEATIALCRDGVWKHYVPQLGWRCHVQSSGRLATFGSAGWASSERTEQFGIGAWANATDRLSVTSPASLFNGDGGGHQLKINKAALANTGSLVLQTGFSGRAEIGLTGDDDCHIKVSADGTVWKEALIADRISGEVVLPNTPGISNPNLIINGDFQINQRSFAGGALAQGVYGYDRWKADTGGANLSVSGYVVTLASGKLVQVIEPQLWGRSNFANQRLTISVEAPSADLTVLVGATSGTIVAGTGRREVSLLVAGTETGPLSIRIGAASEGSVTFGRVKVELGGRATPLVPRPLSQEEHLCFRYYFVLAGTHYVDAYQEAGGYISWYASLPVRMRFVPVTTFSVIAQYNTDSIERGVQALNPMLFRVFAKVTATGRGYTGFQNVLLNAEL